MSAPVVIRCENEDDGPYHIEVNGVSLCTASYDEDGSNGMRKLIKLAKSLAKVYGAEVHEVFGARS